MSIAQAYNSWAVQYDSNENKTRDLDKSATIATLSRYNFSQVLELGCGTGKNTAWLLSKAESIIGIDFSQAMLDIAKTKLPDARVVFMQADLTKAWKIDHEVVDLVTSSLTLEHIEDLNHIFKQASLKLRDKGLFFICELHPFKQYTGSKAKFETTEGIQELEVYTHHLSDYISNAENNGFKLLEIKEWFDESPSSDIPRLISFVFEKQ